MDFIFVFLLLENILERFIPILTYFDEAITAFCFFSLLKKLFEKKQFEYNYRNVLICCVCVLSIGILSSIFFRIQNNLFAILKDIIAFLKFFIVIIFAFEVEKTNRTRKECKNILFFSKVYSVILGCCALINQLFDVGMDSGYRGFVKTYMFLYSHSTFMVSVIVVLISVFIFDGIKKNRIFLFFCLISLFFSMRSKAFIYIIGLFILILFKKNLYIQVKNIFYNKKLRYVLICIMVSLTTLILFLTVRKVINYFCWGLNAARPALYIVGFRIMVDYFPLGTGFASFASSISGEYYSPLYYKYEISNTSGLIQSEGFPYIADTYWPYIIGEFGLFGSIAYLGALYNIFRLGFNLIRRNDNLVIAYISLWIYLVESSFVEATFTNAPIILFCFGMAYYIRIQNE